MPKIVLDLDETVIRDTQNGSEKTLREILSGIVRIGQLAMALEDIIAKLDCVEGEPVNCNVKTDKNLN